MDVHNHGLNPSSDMLINDELTESSSAGSVSLKKTTSKVLKCFERIIENGKEKAKCKKCGRLYVANGTLNLWRHVKSVCVFRDSAGHGVEKIEFNQDTFREKLVKAMIQHNLPFTFAEYEEARDVFTYLNPRVKDISRDEIVAEVLKIYQIEKEKLKKVLGSISGRICLTSGFWSSIASNDYMTVTAHYVDSNWVLQSKLLAFRHIPPPHDGQNISEKLMSFLQEWGIEEKVFTLTLDDAKYNEGVIDLLRNHLRLTNSLFCDGEFVHIQCGARILNLIVHDGLETIGEPIEKIRESVKYVGVRIETFEICQVCQAIGSKDGLEVETRFALSLEFDLFDARDNYKWCPSQEEWGRVEKIVMFLRPLFEMTEFFSGSQYPTTNLYFPIVLRMHVLIQDGMISEDPVISQMATRMKPEFEKYWESYSTILSFAVILDPRYKLQFVKFGYDKLDEFSAPYKVRDLKVQMQKLFEEYLHASLLASTHSSSISEGDIGMKDEFIDEFDAIKRQEDVTRRQSQLEMYLEEPLTSRKRFPELDVLEYWKTSIYRYPELAQMARDILSIPITTVASESAFGHGGRILEKVRNSLLPSNAEAILCGHNWLEVFDNEDEEVEEQLSIDVEKLVLQIGSAPIDWQS